jgi:hypothetical protein
MIIRAVKNIAINLILLMCDALISRLCSTSTQRCFIYTSAPGSHKQSIVAIQGPITRARARQLQYQVKSFLSSTPCQLQDRLLPNEILIVRNEGQAYEGLKNQLGGGQGRRHGAGPETGRAQHDGSLLGDKSESYSDSRTSAPSN